jgi:hypothetical protein
MKYDPKVNSLIQQIAGLCYQIKCAHGIDVFFHWYAHMELFEISTSGAAWAKETPPNVQLEVYVDQPNCLEALRAIRDYLQSMLTGDNRPTGQKEE